MGGKNPTNDWKSRAGTTFEVAKNPATSSRVMVVTNHPLASAAGVEMYAMGGNAVDAAIAAVFALTVVEPMMVGPFGGGYINLRTGNGHTLCVDNYTTAPAAASPDMYRPISGSWPDYLLTEGRQNQVGYLAVGVPGNLKAWDEVHSGHGRLDWEAVVAPAIRYARRGFRASQYLAHMIQDQKEDLAAFAASADIFVPNGLPVVAGDLIVRSDYAESLEAIAASGADELYSGPLGRTIADDIAKHGGLISISDLEAYSTIHTDPVVGTYRGLEIAGPPPGNSGITLLVEMLNIVEHFDVAALGFGTTKGAHLIAEVLKIAFADRFEYLGDPASIEIPLDWITSKSYAAARWQDIDMTAAATQEPGRRTSESSYTTHVTTADDEGTMVSMTQTINELFGSKVTVPGTGILLNNTQAMFDPHPGQPNSIAANKRVVSSMAPTIVSREGRALLGIGTPGGVRIFGAVMQAILNVVDHAMTLQEAVEAPRVWTQGQQLELEASFGEPIRSGLSTLGHDIKRVPNVAGGMNAITVDAATGMMTGAACWRADGAPAGMSGGNANTEARFNPLL